MPGRDPQHWLFRFAPREWIQAALAELTRAEQLLAQGDRKGGLAGCRRAAGMGVNALMAIGEAPDARFGRSYMDHLNGLAADEAAPAEVREAARALLQTPMPGGPIVLLRTAGADTRLVDAARTVMAHAYAAVIRSEPIETS